MAILLLFKLFYGSGVKGGTIRSNWRFWRLSRVPSRSPPSGRVIPLGKTRGLIVKGVASAALSAAVMPIIFRKYLLEILKKVLRKK